MRWTDAEPGDTLLLMRSKRDLLILAKVGPIVLYGGNYWYNITYIDGEDIVSAEWSSEWALYDVMILSRTKGLIIVGRDDEVE